MNRIWRLIPPMEASGVLQMAIDEWLLEQHRLGNGLPCLRFYTWFPIAISLGYHQRHYPEHWRTMQWQGQSIDLVRRPSGGRAVLHQGDLTYSIVTSGYHGRRRDIYTELCQFLIEGWQRLGISLHLGTDQRSYQRSANCFGTATAADLVMDTGYKVIGSAQLYRDSCILQHGSIRLAPDPDLAAAVFGGTPITPPNVFRTMKPTAVIAALTAAAQHIFDISLKLQPLSLQEQQQVTLWAQDREMPL
ncbi:lipoate--protein ligase family protein [Leptolyngbya cf. ectocarpi LEGE 11479]|uniref:Lipoate--protein ligase family protein n=1 Tax=Leptolyngbya cf. ectocarpi LEGE 11479 TaxID=1828722 RepID=A0A928WYG3_LEPEC|nr:biotin/lipoate A/B protein ligase family protein [Leptolyngbya ectocarpi]MBE9065162.1 lipoate--protein ligase family protein [Leptolyngbya cf. ectocarpi LEGE 11479]